MPLQPGNSAAAKSANIRELMKPSANAPEGRPQRQAVAIALSEARKRGGKKPPKKK